MPSAMPEDPGHDSLFRRAAAGDSDALAELFEHHVPALRRQITQALPRRHQGVLSVDDCLQQTLVDAFRDFHTFADQTRTRQRSNDDNLRAVGSWLATLARRNTVDAVRMLDADKRGGNLRAKPVDPAAFIDALTDGRLSRSPPRAAAMREACEAMNRALDALPETYARIIRGYDLEGRPMADLAAELGRSRGAAFMLRARALRALRDALGSTTAFFSSIA